MGERDGEGKKGMRGNIARGNNGIGGNSLKTMNVIGRGTLYNKKKKLKETKDTQ